MKKAISILLAASMLIFATVVTAETAVGTVENRSANTTFAASADDGELMPCFEPGDEVSFTVSGISNGDYITVLSYRYGEVPTDPTQYDENTQYIDQWDDLSGPTQDITYIIRDIDTGIFDIKIKVGNNEIYTGYYKVVESSGPQPVVNVTGVTVAPTSKTLAVGETQQLTETVEPNNATNKAVTWSSSNEAAATVSASGLVTAVAEGTATITVTTTDGNKTAECAITVTAAPVQLLGDIDGSGAVDIDDAILLFNYSMFPDFFPISYVGSVDFNKDSDVNIDDAILLFNYSMFPDFFPID